MTVRLCDLNFTYQNYVKALMNKLGIDHSEDNFNDLSWIYDNVVEIKKIINNQNSVSTKKGHYNLLSKVFSKMNKITLRDECRKLAFNFKSQYLEKLKLQIPKTNGLTWKFFMERRSYYKKYCDVHSSHYSSHLNYLILCLYTYQPPLRSEYTNMLFVSTKPSIDDNNYLYKNNKNYVIILNNYKTVSTQGKFKQINIESKFLTDLFDFSFKNFPRKYVLTLNSNVDLPMKYPVFYKYNTLKIFGKRLSIDDIRSSYITQYYSNKSMDEFSTYEFHSHINKEALAYKMCNGPDTASLSYWKSEDTSSCICDDYLLPGYSIGVISDDDNDDLQNEEYDDLDFDIPDCIVDVVTDDDSKHVDIDSDIDISDYVCDVISDDESKSTTSVNVKKFDKKEYYKHYSAENATSYRKSAKKYYDGNKLSIIRHKIIKNINSGLIKKPRKDSIKKYNLKFNKKTSVWY